MSAEFRLSFLSPKHTSPKRKTAKVSVLGKRKFAEAFGGSSGNADEERYGQSISESFFDANIGHGVVVNIIEDIIIEDIIDEDVDDWMTEAHGKVPKGAVGRPSATIPEGSPAGICLFGLTSGKDLNVNVNDILRRERDCEEKYDSEELLEWCTYYLKNRNLFNV